MLIPANLIIHTNTNILSKFIQLKNLLKESERTFRGCCLALFIIVNINRTDVQNTKILIVVLFFL